MTVYRLNMWLHIPEIMVYPKYWCECYLLVNLARYNKAACPIPLDFHLTYLHITFLAPDYDY